MSWSSDEEVDLDALDRIEAEALGANGTAPSSMAPQPEATHLAAGAPQHPAASNSTLNTIGTARSPQQPLNNAPSEQQQQQNHLSRLLSGNLPPPTTLQELSQRASEFHKHFDQLGPPNPPHNCCPGVYGKGCGGALRWVDGYACDDRPPFWGCEHYAARSGCSYKYYPPERGKYPRLDIVIVDVGTIEVCAFPCAKEAVQACGGVEVILRIIPEIDMTRVLPLPETAAQSRRNSLATATTIATATGIISPGGDRRASISSLMSTHSRSRAGPSGGGGHEFAAAAAPAAGVCFPFAYYEQLRKALQNTKPGGYALMPSGRGIPEGTLKAFRSPITTKFSMEEVNARYASLPPSLEAALLPFQREGVRFGLERGGRCLIGDEMGVGKTVQGIALAACYREDSWPLLVVCPASLRLVWAEELEKWLPGLSPTSIHIISDKTGRLQTQQPAANGAAGSSSGGGGGGSNNAAGPSTSTAPSSSTAPSNSNAAPQQQKSLSQLPEVTITSYKMLEHLCCEACKNSKAWRDKQGTAPKSPYGKYKKVTTQGSNKSTTSNTTSSLDQRPCQQPETCMASLGYKMIIVDESHNLRTSPKGTDAMHTEAVRSTARKASRLIFLSGTPSLSKPFDIFNQIDILHSGLLGKDRTAFAEAYCNRRLVPCFVPWGPSKVYDNSGLARPRELYLLLRQEVMVRRLKKEVLSELPPKRRQVIRFPKPPAKEWVDVDGQGRQVMLDSDAEDDSDTEEGGVSGGLELGDAARGAAADAGGVAQNDSPSKLPANAAVVGRKMSTFHRTGLAKCSAAVEWFLAQLGLEDSSTGEGGEGEEEESQEIPGQEETEPATTTTTTSTTGSRYRDAAPPKFIVFAHHLSVLNRLEAALVQKNNGRGRRRPFIEYVAIRGETDQEGRREAVERFRNDPRVRVALLSVTAAGTGLDFSAASAVVFVELPSEVSLVRQAEDRAHRQGQRNTVNVYFLCARGTADERRWQKLDSSLARVGQVHDGPLQQGAAVDNGGGAGGDGNGGGGGSGGAHAGGGNAGVAARLGEAAGLQVDEVTTLADPETDNLGDGVGDVVMKEVVAETPSGGGGGGQEIKEITAISELPLPSSLPLPIPPSTVDLQKEADISSLKTIQVADPGTDTDHWWFEVSSNTQRVHFHAASDRSAPLRVSLPIEALCIGDAPAVDQLIHVVSKQLKHQEKQQQQRIAQEGSSSPLPPLPAMVVGGVGPVAVDLNIIKSEAQMRGALAVARAFAREWRELRAAIRNRLSNRLLQAPLEDAAEDAEAEAVSDGAFGVTTDRFLVAGPGRKDVKLPNGATWQTTQVHYARMKRVVSYIQAVILPRSSPSSSFIEEVEGGANISGDYGDNRGNAASSDDPRDPSAANPTAIATINSSALRLCIHCMKEVPGGGTKPLDAVLQSPCFLFCGPECEKKYAIKSSRGEGRRRVFQRDRGICQECKLDCGTMVRRLQAVERGTKNWRSRRRLLLESQYPEFTRLLGKEKLISDLIERATPGQTWQADHIVAVYQGGGQCDIDNLRTLCTPCHKEVTKKQTKERGVERRAAKRASCGEPARGRVKRQRGVHIDESDDEEEKKNKGGKTEEVEIVKITNGGVVGRGRGRGRKGGMRRGTGRDTAGGGRGGGRSGDDNVVLSTAAAAAAPIVAGEKEIESETIDLT